MTPTPEQVAAWAREAGAFAEREWYKSGGSWQHLRDERFAALVDAHRAEQDAQAVRFADNGTEAEEIIRASMKGGAL